MNVQGIQNNKINFGMAAKIPTWQRTANKVGKNLADAIDDARPTIEELAKKQTVKIIPQKARNLYDRGFKIIVSPTEYNVRGRDFIDRILKPAPFVSETVRNRDVKEGQMMKDALISSVKKLISDLKKYGYGDITSII